MDRYSARRQDDLSWRIVDGRTGFTAELDGIPLHGFRGRQAFELAVLLNLSEEHGPTRSRSSPTLPC